MAGIKKKWRNLSLRKAFVITVFVSVGMIALLSAITIFGCLEARKYLFPDSKMAYLGLTKEYEDGSGITEEILISLDADYQEIPVTISSSISAEDEQGEELEKQKEMPVKYSITKADTGFQFLSPKRKLAYQALGVGIIVLPAIYAVIGVLLSAFWFYRHKLSRPIERLEYSIGQIQQQNLEFEVGFVGEDELGRVCSSFDEMRKILYQNNQSLWNMLEERKRLQASVAHDLRNPITIIQTYAEYLNLNIGQGSITQEQLKGMVDNLQITAKRMEEYTDSIRNISRLEELELSPVLTDLSKALPDMKEELGVLAEKEHKKLIADELTGELWGMADISALYRILENLVANASRYAEEMIWMKCSAGGDGITIQISDDGPGFPKKVLSGKRTYFTTADNKSGHLGMGLSICRILCRKLGGRLELANKKDGGAEAVIYLVREPEAYFHG